MKSTQNEISQNYLSSRKFDLAKKEIDILKDASHKTGFKPEKLYYRSSWWTSKEIGAFTYKGAWNDKKAIIKVQGVKPDVSEIYMIQSFQKNNKSKIIRPPKLYNYLDWNDIQRYEALVLEDVGHKKVVSNPANQNEVTEFYKIYKEYRQNCISSPWIEKPNENLSIAIEKSFRAWKKISFHLYPDHPLRKKDDPELIDRAIKVLSENFKNIEPEFMHGHFSVGDLIKFEDQIILRSNLYWSWRNPYRDAVFAYHWHMLNLHKIKNITKKQIDEQNNIWLNKIVKIPNNKHEEKLIKLAMLERSTASLNLDILSIDPRNETSKYLVEKTRDYVMSLLDELN